MSLRCLLFSSNEEMVQPIWQVLTDLGIEGEYCRNAVDAVERVTTQLFQIVITDWEDQPEAGFLLKTARDLKAAHRPLTLAIVSDSAKLPEALQAGANSVLMKPIRIEQVRDTMSTACELLRSKERPAGERPATPASAAPSPPTANPAHEATNTDTVALAASASASASAAAAPASVRQVFEKNFRAGEFLQSPGSAPGAQFDTESELQKSLDQAAASEVDALTELEPTAAAVQDAVAEPTEPGETQEPLTGWAALQARLTKRAPAPAEDAPPTNEMLSYTETTSYAGPAPNPVAEQSKEPVKKESKQDAESEAALFAYISGEAKESSQPEGEPHSKRGKSGRLLFAGVLALAGIVLVAVPRARQSSGMFYRNAVRAGKSWLNPAPTPLPPAVVQHDSFGQAGDEYKLPSAANIPDAATDPSQIRVVPVIDPTAKPDKNSEANGAQVQSPAASSPADPAQTNQGQTNQSQTAQNPSAQAQVATTTPRTSNVPATGNVPGTSAEAAPTTSSAQSQPTPPAAQPTPPPSHPAPGPAQPSPSPSAPAGASSTDIPSSLKSQIASSTPDSSGTMPAEAAMSSIEPVRLPESAARQLLAQPVDPVYPDAAKAGGLRGSVILQVLVARDGTVQDAKFLQGSLVFARAAIDAVKQWRFKPYSMNGRAVSVQTVISLNFAPPA
jgi:TonB family protein